AVQWWGTAGGLHGLAPKPEGTLRGRTIEGQHAEAWLNHTADLSRVLDAELARHWRALAQAIGIATVPLSKADGRTTRGDWVRAAFKAARSTN
ncbi:MAG: FAD-dependent oxidoreductase, partial [Opitutaceae bacterium]